MEITTNELVELIECVRKKTENDVFDAVRAEVANKPKHYKIGIEVTYDVTDKLCDTVRKSFNLIYADGEGAAIAKVVSHIKMVAVAHNMRVVENVKAHQYEFYIEDKLHFTVDHIRAAIVDRVEV